MPRIKTSAAKQSRAKKPVLVLPPAPDLALERELARQVDGSVAGVDEAGRGPWAGPVVTAAVILDPAAIPAGLNDSKKLSEAERERLYGEICAVADVGVCMASVARIDFTDIRAATLWAMRRAVAALPDAPSAVLIDGRDVPPGLACPGRNVIKGDARSLSIAAASIVAKVTRDRLMLRLAELFPGYGYERHKGYGTAAHAAALDIHGVTDHHRKSFRPIRERLERG